MPERSQKRSTDSLAGSLNRELIVEAALAQIDAHGLQGLSMRSLGQDLGVEAMSLYRYVNGREDLLEGVVALLMDDLTSHLDEHLVQRWQGFLQAVAHHVRSIAIAHPKAFPLVASRHPAAPWLRPPLRSVEVVDTFLTALLGYGFTDEHAVFAYRSFTSFLLGQLLLESAVRGGSTAPDSEPLDEGDADVPGEDGQAELDNAPQVVRLRPLLSDDRSEEEFEVALEALLDRLDARLSQ